MHSQYAQIKQNPQSATATATVQHRTVGTGQETNEPQAGGRGTAEGKTVMVTPGYHIISCHPGSRVL